MTTNSASDYSRLSEILTQGNFFEEAVSSLEKAIVLEPATYDTKANRETWRARKVAFGYKLQKAGNGNRNMSRYPETKDFLGDFQKLIRDHIAVNLNREPKFLELRYQIFHDGLLLRQKSG